MRRLWLRREVVLAGRLPLVWGKFGSSQNGRALPQIGKMRFGSCARRLPSLPRGTSVLTSSLRGNYMLFYSLWYWGRRLMVFFRMGTIVLIIAPYLCITLTIVRPFLSNPLFCQHLKTLKIERFPDFRIQTRLVFGTGLRPFPPLPFPVYICPPPSPPRFPSSSTVCSRPGQSFVWD